MICDRKPIRAYEGAGSAVVETNAGQTYVIQPFLIRRKGVTSLQLFERHVVECPHAFVGKMNCGARNRTKQKCAKQQRNMTSHRFTSFVIQSATARQPIFRLYSYFFVFCHKQRTTKAETWVFLLALFVML